MITSKAERIKARLVALQSLTPELEAAAVISVEGLMISSSLPESVAEDRMAAMSAAMLALGERIAKDLDRGELTQMYIKGNDGYVVLMSVDDRAVLASLASEDAKLGLVLLDLQEAVVDLKRLL
ncbi:MAG: roadblock/LC7 domain-containing protein [Chloroflexota bacterium]|nr:roadblock/LC7 domain-containing protein [Chloroflexota bacterium]